MPYLIIVLFEFLKNNYKLELGNLIILLLLLLLGSLDRMRPSPSLFTFFLNNYKSHVVGYKCLRARCALIRVLTTIKLKYTL